MTRAQRARSLHQRCRDLFGDYPEAVSADAQFIGVCVPGEPCSRDCVLVRREDGSFTIGLWNRDGGTVITADTRQVPAGYATAIAAGIPFPRDGSLYGWVSGETAVTTLIAFRADPDDPEPRFAPMPRAGSNAGQWPPFAAAPAFDAWFWDYREAGQLVSLRTTIRQTAGQVFWSAQQIPGGGPGVIAVAAPIAVPGGRRLEAGVYVYHAALRDGVPVPSLAQVLTDQDKTDLAALF
jgi:hypothetical protein